MVEPLIVPGEGRARVEHPGSQIRAIFPTRLRPGLASLKDGITTRCRHGRASTGGAGPVRVGQAGENADRGAYDLGS
jgi:hypothetical protein